MDENTASSGSHAAAEAAEANGHNGHRFADDLSDLPADFGKALAKRQARIEHERPPSPYDKRREKFAAASAVKKAAIVVSGRYAADACTGLTPAGRACLSQLMAVKWADLAAVAGLTGSPPTENEVTAWHAARGRTWNPPAANGIASLTDVKVATAGIDPKVRYALADVVSAAHDGQPWAAKVIDTAQAENAYAALVGDRKQRPVSLTPAQLFDRGAPLDAIRALPDETKLTRGQSARIVRAWDAEERLRAAEQAHAIEAAKAVAAIEIPGRINLATYTPPDTAWLVDGLMPMNGSLGLFAERKAGKTTTVVELVRAVLSGEEFLGRFATNLPAGARVALLDTEMTPAMLHHEYTKVGMDADHLDRIDLHPLRGRSRLLDLRDETTRARWRELIAPGSVIIVDCLYTVLAAAQVDESSAQVSDIIDGIKALAVESRAAGLVIVHHLGKDPGKGARGHSSIEGGVDTLATIWLDGPPAADTPRLFSATGRLDVDVPTALLRRGDDFRLTLSTSTPKADRAKAVDHKDDDIAWELISDHPGKSLRGLENLPTETRKLSRTRLRRALERLDLLGYVVNQGTPDRPAWYAADRNGDPMNGPAPLAD